MDRVSDADTQEQLNPSMNAEKIQKFIVWLQQFRLEKYELELMVDRYAYGKTFKDISDDRGYTGVGIVHRLYKMAEAKVRRGIERIEHEATKDVNHT